MRGDLSVDALLARWPAPARDDDAWDGRADEILAAARAAGPAKDDVDALLGAPKLEAVPGEPGAAGAMGDETVSGGGVAKMADESKAGEGKGEATSTTSSEAPPSTVAPKRPSLKEIAARASQGGARPSIPGAAPSMRSPRISSPGVAPAPMASRPAPKAEIADEDSGIVNLAAAAEPEPAVEEKPAAASMPPAAKSDPGKADEQGAAASLPPAAAAPAPKAAAAAKAAPAPEPKGGNGAVAGIAIAIVGLAAAFFIVQRGKEAPPPAAAHGPGVETAPTAVIAPAPQAAEAPAATVAAAAPSAAPEASAAPKVALGGPMPSGAAAAGKGAASGVAAASPAPGAANPAIPPAGSAKPGDLAGAMAQAVGGAQASKGGDEAKPEPAAGSRNQTIPERPSQGKVQAAVRSALPAAKACVAGAEDVSNANITFGSSGSVTSVSVSGWAASHGQTGCVKSAFSSVNVGPFQQSSYSFSATIRP